MRSISWKLWGSLLLVVILSTGLMAFITNQLTDSRFQEYITQSNTNYAINIATSLGNYYENENSWDGLQAVISSMRISADYRLVVANTAGIIVADSDGDLIGDESSVIGLEDGVSITGNNTAIGTVYILTTGTTTPTMGRGRGRMGNTAATSEATAIANNAEEDFLHNINIALVISGAISVIVALTLGWILTRQITKPVLSLNKGALQIAKGNLRHRVNVTTKDELGTLAGSFNNMADSLEQGEEERRRIIADIAHELRTPLTVIDGTVDAIMDGIFEPDQERLSSIKEQTLLLTHLIKDLRDLSLAESGQLKLILRKTDIVDLLRRKIAQLQMQAQAKNIALTMHDAQNIPAVDIDATRIEQVIYNLTTNAIRHTHAGGSINVSINRFAKDIPHGLTGEHIVIAINDSGEGIAPEHLPHIFERFYRVDPSRSRNEGGTGLGLAIAKRLTQAHRGTVWADSELGKGSTFYVALPLE